MNPHIDLDSAGRLIKLIEHTEAALNATHKLLLDECRTNHAWAHYTARTAARLGLDILMLREILGKVGIA